jgi:hypothetical protein
MLLYINKTTQRYMQEGCNLQVMVMIKNIENRYTFFTLNLTNNFSWWLSDVLINKILYENECFLQ